MTRVGGTPPLAGGDASPSGEPASVAHTTRESERELDRAFAFLLRSSGQRPQTEAELAVKLRRRGVGDDVARRALKRAKQAGAIDDAAFARAWVSDRGRGRGYGVARLRRELERRKVPAPLIDAALDDLEGRDEEAVATGLARSRLQRLPGHLPPEAVARRLVGYLVRRGYTPALAQRVARSVSGLDRAWD